MAFFISLQPWDKEVVDKTIVISDAIGYNQLALSLVTNKSFNHFDNLRTPGYPVFIALIYDISNESVWFVLFVQILLSLISVFLVFKIASKIFSENIALLSAFLFAIDINQAYYTLTLLTETLFVTLFISSIYFLCKSLKENTLLSVFVSALLLGVATLVRPVSFLFPVVAVFSLLLFMSQKVKLNLIYSLIFIVIYIASISPWLIHNYSKYGEAKLTSLSGWNLLFWYAAYTEAYKTGKSIEVVREDFANLAVEKGADLSEWDSFENSKIYSDIAKEYIKNNFGLYFKRHMMGVLNIYTGLNTKKIAELFHLQSRQLPHEQFAAPGLLKRISDFYKSKSNAEIIISMLIGFYLLVNYIFSLIGIYILLGKRDKYTFLFIFIILYFSLLTGVIGMDRYRMPFMPFINILCAFGFSHFYANTLKKFGKAIK